MPTARLTDRAIVTVAGADAEAFLQNILTVDLDQLRDGEAKPGALLSPQGKILFDFLIFRANDGTLCLDCPAGAANDFARRLMLYRLRAKVEISMVNEVLVSVAWRIDSAGSSIDSRSASDGAVSDTRFAAGSVTRHYEHSRGIDASESDWHAFRIAAGVPESGDDYTLGDAFPHDVLLDQMGGIGFRKGCYVGQEVVSRMQHRGTARKRVLKVEGTTDLPATGSVISSGGRPIGSLGSVSGRSGLALVRIDKVQDAVDSGSAVEAGGTPIALSIPHWASFAFPAGVAADET